MSWGLRVKRNGVTEFGPTTNAGRFLGAIEISADGSASVAGLADGTPEPFLMPLGPHYWLPVVSISGTTISWSYGSAPVSSPGGRTPCILVVMVR